MSRAPVAILAGHGGFAEGMRSAAEAIMGAGELFVTVSNEGLDSAGIEEALRDAVDRTGVRIILTDLHAGSVAMAARRLLFGRPELVLVTGINLPVVLTLASPAVAVPADVVPEAVESARQGMQHHAGKPRGD